MKLTVDATLTPAILAESFCAMDDEAQAQFFIEVAKVAATWKSDFGPGQQWFMVGRHLRDCGCSNEAARKVVTEIADGIEGRPPPAEVDVPPPAPILTKEQGRFCRGSVPCCEFAGEEGTTVKLTGLPFTCPTSCICHCDIPF